MAAVKLFPPSYCGTKCCCAAFVSVKSLVALCLIVVPLCEVLTMNALHE